MRTYWRGEIPDGIGQKLGTIFFDPTVQFQPFNFSHTVRNFFGFGIVCQFAEIVFCADVCAQDDFLHLFNSCPGYLKLKTSINLSYSYLKGFFSVIRSLQKFPRFKLFSDTFISQFRYS